MPYTQSPWQDPVTGQRYFEFAEGAPAVLKKRISDGDYIWGRTSSRKRNGKKVTQYLVDNDFAYVESFSLDDILTCTFVDLDALELLPAPGIEGHSVLVDQRTRTNVIALINDPSGLLA